MAELIRPLAIVTLGNSVAVLQNPPRTRRSDGTYTEVAVDRLYERGVPAVAHLEARWFDFIHRALRRYESSVRVHQPDVLIVQYGINELQPWLVPVWLLRHLITRHHSVTRTTQWYRKVVAERVWKRVRAYRRWVAPYVGLRTWQVTPRRFAGKLTKLVHAARTEHRCLVLILDVFAPGPVLRHFLPGIDRRHAIYQQTLSDVVADFADPDVRLVRVSELVTPLGDEDGLPDGQHLTVTGHRLIGERLAEEIFEWQRASH